MSIKDTLFSCNGSVVDHLYYTGAEEQMGGVLARAVMFEKTGGKDWVKGHFREGKYVPGYRRVDDRKKKPEEAKGLPSRKRLTPLPNLKEGSNTVWEFGLHDHTARKRGRHFDLRLGNPVTGIAHSWALTRLRFPEPGDSVWAIMQPDHTVDYMDFKGTIQDGYGAGKVDLAKRGITEIVYSSPERIKFVTHEGRDSNEFVLVRTSEKARMWKLLNVTPTRDKKLKDLPTDKPTYKEVPPEKINFEAANELLQAKIDGAHALVDLQPGKQTRVFSYRPTEGKTGVREYTHKIPGMMGTRGSKETGKTILRGEVYAKDKDGKALQAKDVGGMLNAGVQKSRLLQAEKGELTTAIFDVVKHKGKDAKDMPYSEKLRILREIAKREPNLHVPDTADDPKEKKRLYDAIKAKLHGQTDEGVIVWDKDKPGPTKAKHRPDFDVHVRGVFEAKGKTDGKGLGRAGGFVYSWTPDGPIAGKVGTGFDHKLATDMWENPDEYVGKVAKVRSQGRFDSDALRAPSFSEWHMDKGKEAGFLSQPPPPKQPSSDGKATGTALSGALTSAGKGGDPRKRLIRAGFGALRSTVFGAQPKIAAAVKESGQATVKGYWRNGRYVQGHRRKHKDGTPQVAALTVGGLPFLGAIGKTNTQTLQGPRMGSVRELASQAKQGDVVMLGAPWKKGGRAGAIKTIISAGTGTPHGYHTAIVEKVLDNGDMQVLELGPVGYRRSHISRTNPNYMTLLRPPKGGARAVVNMQRQVAISQKLDVLLKQRGLSKAQITKVRSSLYHSSRWIPRIAIRELFMPVFGKAPRGDAGLKQYETALKGLEGSLGTHADTIADSIKRTGKLPKNNKVRKLLGSVCTAALARSGLPTSGAGPVNTIGPAEFLRTKGYKRLGHVIPKSQGLASDALNKILRVAPHMVRGGVGALLGYVTYKALGGGQEKTAEAGAPEALAAGGGTVLAASHLAPLVRSVDKRTDAGKVITILYTDPSRGAGHYQQALNVAEAFKAKGKKVRLVNVEREFASKEQFKRFNDVYRKWLDGKASSASWKAAWARFYLSDVDNKALNKVLGESGAVVLTNPGLQYVARGSKLPLNVVHSDPTMIQNVKSWSSSPIRARDIHFAPKGVDLPDAARVVRLDNPPLDPRLFKGRRSVPGLDPKHFNVTISGGATGTDVDHVLRKLMRSGVTEVDGKPVRFHVVTGGTWGKVNPERLKALQTLAARDPKVVVHGRVPLADMLADADFNVLRAHGTTGTEAVMAKKPAVWVIRGDVPAPGAPITSGNTRNAMEFSRRTGAPVASWTEGTKNPIDAAFRKAVKNKKSVQSGVEAAAAKQKNTAVSIADDILNRPSVRTKGRLPGGKHVRRLALATGIVGGGLMLHNKLRSPKRRHKYIWRQKGPDGRWKYTYPKDSGATKTQLGKIAAVVKGYRRKDGTLVRAHTRHTVITGQPGSGKSTLARKMSKETGQPLVQLDDHPLAAKAYKLWKRGGKHTPEINKIRRAILKDVLALKKPHIIEGSQALVDPTLSRGHKRILLNPSEKLTKKRWVDRELSRHIAKSEAKGVKPTKDRAHYERLSANIHGIYRREVGAFAKDDAQLSRPTAVIVKGNPKAPVKGAEKHGDAFYDKLKGVLESEGYEVSFDPGKPHTSPKAADVWVGHSRGVDRLRFAPAGTKTIAIGSEEPDAINHPDDVAYMKEVRDTLLTGGKNWKDIPEDQRPSAPVGHITLTGDMEKEFRSRLSGGPQPKKGDRRFFHGSPTPGISVLEPRKDPRTGKTGLFVATEKYSPEIFSLMSERHSFTKNLTTKGGKFVKGEVIGKGSLNDEGYVYEVEAAPGSIKEWKPGRFVLTQPAKVTKVRKVTKDEVLKRGWKVSPPSTKVARAMNADWTPAKVHKLADRHGVKWDDHAPFMRWCEKITGEKHLDDMDKDQLRKVAVEIIKRKVRPTTYPKSRIKLAWSAAALEEESDTDLFERTPPAMREGIPASEYKDRKKLIERMARKGKKMSPDAAPGAWSEDHSPFKDDIDKRSAAAYNSMIEGKTAEVQASPFSPQVKRKLKPVGMLKKTVRTGLQKSQRVAKFTGAFDPTKVPKVTPIKDIAAVPPV